MSAVGLTINDAFRARLYQAVLLALGGLLYATASIIAEWLVGMFGATMALPGNTHRAVTTLLFLGLVYGVALHTEPDDDKTLIGKLLGGDADA